jgi:hypothetical protein
MNEEALSIETIYVTLLQWMAALAIEIIYVTLLQWMGGISQ